MITLRKRILLIVGGVFVVVVGILLWVFFHKKAVPVQIDTTPTTDTTTLPPIGDVDFKKPETTPVSTVSPSNPDETFAKQTARIFVERFWSYSNQNDNTHIDDALLLSSPTMRTWIQSQEKEQSGSYVGVTTNVLSSRILSYTAQKTSVEIGAAQTTQTAQADGKIIEETKNITAKVDLVKSGNDWLVEGIWKE